MAVHKATRRASPQYVKQKNELSLLLQNLHCGTEILLLSNELAIGNTARLQTTVFQSWQLVVENMEPIGAAASIIALLEVAYRLCEYISDVKDGGKDRMKLLKEVTSLCCTLDTLKEKVDQSQSTRDDSAIKILTNPDGPIHQCREVVNELTIKLKPSQNKTGRVAQRLKWSFSKEEVLQAVDQLHRIQATITNALQQALLSVAQKIHDDGAITRRLAEEQHTKQIRDWLSPLNFVTQQKAVCDSRCPGTGLGLLSSKKFEQFKHSVRSVMWCPGPPGAGKTHLASIIVHDLQTEKLNDQELDITLIIYCRYDEPECQNIANIVGDLLNQCLSGRPLPDGLLDLYRLHSVSQTRPPYEDLLELLATEIKQIRKCRIVIDALDEFGEPNDRVKLLQGLGSLKASDLHLSNQEAFSLLVMSRPLADIEVAIKRTWLTSPSQGTSLQNCAYGVHQVLADEGDIRRYLHWRIENDYSLKELVQKRPGLQEEVLKSIVHGADSMFLMAKLAADGIATCLTVKELKLSLQQVPTELHLAYDATIQRIRRQGEARRLRAFEVMKWVMFAQRPLKLAEMEQAVSIELHTIDIDFDDVVPATTLASLCAGLVVIDQDKRFRFAHQTVPDYLKSKFPEQFPERDESAADRCLTYIMYKTFSEGPCLDFHAFQTRLLQYPMYIYCSRYWYRHLQGEPTPEQKDLGLQFFSSEAHWLSSRQATRSWQSKTEPLLPAERLWGDSVLHHAAYLNAHLFTQNLLEKEPLGLNKRNFLGRTPLMRAAVHGSVEFARTLLQAGADRFVLDAMGNSALQLALWKRDFEMADLLSSDHDDLGLQHGDRVGWYQSWGRETATMQSHNQADAESHSDVASLPPMDPQDLSTLPRIAYSNENNPAESLSSSSTGDSEGAQSLPRI